MTINRNKLISVKEVRFKPFICDTKYAIMFKIWSFANKICSTESKFVYKSAKILQLIFPLSTFFLISSARLIKAWKTQSCFLKQNCSI